MIDKKKILNDLKADVSSANNLRLEAISKIETWKKEYNGEPYGNEEKGKSAIVSRDIKRQDEWQHASIKEPFVSDVDIVKCLPITFEDRKAAEQNELILNYQFTRQFDRYNFITNTLKELSSSGTAIVKCSWLYEDEKVEVEYPTFELDPNTGEPVQTGTEIVKELKVITNRPDAELCRIEDIYIDPTCQGDMDKCNFIVHRFETDMSSLKADPKYKNLGKLQGSNPRDEGDYIPQDKTFFEFMDKPRKKMLVYEYSGFYDIDGSGVTKPIICTWVKDTIIRLESMPYPDGKLPFFIVSANSTPFELYGEANSEMIGDNQKLTTAIKRGLIDNMANSNNGQKGIRKGALDALNKKRFLNNKNFEYNGSREDFFDGSYNAIPNSVFSVLELINNETESITGVKGFSGGITGKGLGSTATSARGALDAVSVRRLDIVRNIAENLIKKLMRKWMAYNGEFLKEEEVVRITNEEFLPIKRDDLTGAIDITIEVSTAEDNSQKAQELSFLLQTLGQGMDLGMRNLLMGQIAKLNKMPDLAKQLEEYQPQPDPVQQELQQLEIEKLKVEIEEKKSRAEENLVDMRLKTAKAILEEARAKDVQAGTDLKDLDFVDRSTGQNMMDKMVEKDHDRNTQMDLKAMDSLNKQ